MKRRKFLKASASSAALIALHAQLPKIPASPVHPGHQLIQNIRLQTTASIPILINFYHRKLGLAYQRNGKNAVTFSAGDSSLTFAHGHAQETSPFYHFAFNIPANQVASAHQWLADRSEIIPAPEHLRDPIYDPAIVHFRHWNAHSVFFYDPAGNVVEFIARHILRNKTRGAFSTEDILHLSEIGFMADDVPTVAAQLKKETGLAQYSESSQEFSAFGDELGLLLVLKSGINSAFGTGKPRAVYQTEATIDRSGIDFVIEGHPYYVVGSRQ